MKYLLRQPRRKLILIHTINEMFENKKHRTRKVKNHNDFRKKKMTSKTKKPKPTSFILIQNINSTSSASSSNWKFNEKYDQRSSNDNIKLTTFNYINIWIYGLRWWRSIETQEWPSGGAEGGRGATIMHCVFQPVKPILEYTKSEQQSNGHNHQYNAQEETTNLSPTTHFLSLSFLYWPKNKIWIWVFGSREMWVLLHLYCFEWIVGGYMFLKRLFYAVF